MMNKKLALMTVLLFGFAVVFASCAALQKPTAANFKDPVIKLDSVQLSYYEGFWTYGKAKVAKGKAPKFGGSAPVTLAFVFEITNSNSYPVLLDDSRFFLSFDGYELRMVQDLNPMWIPAGKTNSKVLHVTITPTGSWAKFLLVHAEVAKKRGVKPWDLVEKWWVDLPEMSFPIGIQQGSFTFRADGVSKTLAYSTTYP